jgi:hypothetical protein
LEAVEEEEKGVGMEEVVGVRLVVGRVGFLVGER